MSNRKYVPTEIESRVLLSSARRCCMCFHLAQDFTEKLGQIAHLDQDPSNGAEDNLAYLCLNHHTLFDSKTSQHKNYTPDEVKKARERLYEKVSVLGLAKTSEWLLVLDGRFSDLDKPTVEAITEHLRQILDDPHPSSKSFLAQCGLRFRARKEACKRWSA